MRRGICALISLASFAAAGWWIYNMLSLPHNDPSPGFVPFVSVVIVLFATGIVCFGIAIGDKAYNIKRNEAKSKRRRS